MEEGEVRVRLLGPLVVSVGGVDRVIGSRSQRRVLAMLAVAAPDVVSADRLADVVWSGVLPRSWSSSLQTYVSRLRAVLGSVAIRSQPNGYALSADIDLVRFEASATLAVATVGQPELALARCEEALQLWRGRPLPEFADEGWALPTVVRVEELWLSVRERRIEAQLELGRVPESVSAAEDLCRLEPLREGPVGLLMRGLARQGRSADALRVFERFRAHLRDETGLSPSSALMAVERAVLSPDGPVGPVSLLPAAKVSNARPGNLAVQATSFVGRAAELTDLMALVRAHRVVTLTGVGGVGKTRLAVQVAAELMPDFEDGIWMVELAPVGDPAAVPDAVATALGITAQPGMSVTVSVAHALAGRRLLLVLDNCEHVLDAAGDLIEEIVARSTTVKVIATSREGLRVSAEHLWPVLPLDVSRGSASVAVELFVERARAVRPGSDAAAEPDVSAVTEICARLDGIPLAIELAAARMMSMSPQDICDRLADRFRLLSGSHRDVERHQTLRHTVQWSYDLLDDDERLLLQHTSVFADGFVVGAIAQVCGQLDEYDVLDIVDSLVRKSLLVVDQSSGHARYRMLETIRQFADEQLAARGTTIEVRRRHASYYAAKSVEHWGIWDGPRQRVATEWVDVEFANLRAAFRWASDDQDLETAAAIAAHTTVMANNLQRYEPVGWAEELLPAATSMGLRHLPRLHVAAAYCAYMGRPEAAVGYAEAAVELESDSRYLPFEIGWGRYREALSHLLAGHGDRYVAICADLASGTGLAQLIGRVGLLQGLPAVGRGDEARAMADDILAAARAHANPYWIAWALDGYGMAFRPTDPVRALDVFRQALAFTREHRLPIWETNIGQEAAELEAAHGDVARALVLFDDVIEACRQAGALGLLAATFAKLSMCFDRFDRPDVAAVFCGAAAQHPITKMFVRLHAAADHVREDLGGARFDECVAAGAAMDLADAVRYAHDQIQIVRSELATS